MKVLSRTNIFSLAIAAILMFSGAAHAASKTNKQLYSEAVSQINAAAALGDDALIASIIAKAAVDNPALVKALTTYAVKKSPQAAPAIVEAVQKAAPKLVQKVTTAATVQLSKDPKNATILAQVKNIKPPVVQKGSGPTVRNKPKPIIVPENPNQASTNSNAS